MRVTTDRQVLVLTVLVSAASAVYVLVVTGGDWATVAISLPMFTTVAYFSLLVSKRIGRRFGPKPPPPQEPTPPVDSTSERPEHAQRRRVRRRQRGRQRGRQRSR